MILDRHGRKVPLSFDSITERNAKLAEGLSRVNLTLITERVIADRTENMTTADLDMLSIDACLDLELRDDHQYSVLASGIGWSNLVKTAPKTFAGCVELAIGAGIVNEKWSAFCVKHINKLEEMMAEECSKEENDPTYLRDHYSYLAYQMLTSSYLLKIEQRENNDQIRLRTLADGSQRENKKTFHIIERPSYALMRIAVQLHMPDLGEIERCVQRFYNRSVCPATPVWQHSGGLRPCLSSCNLYSIQDSLEGLQKSWIQQSTISARGGGLGGTWSYIRSKNSVIQSSQGLTSSAVSWCRMAEAIAQLVNQGGRRAGSNAVYFDMTHGDIADLIHLRAPNAGTEDIRCPELHTAIWSCDAFFARLEYQLEHPTETIYWPTFNPAKYPELIDLWGPAKTQRIEELEREMKFVERVPILNIWNQYCNATSEKGEPYMHNGCTVNAKSNHINLGTVTSSNLCGEIVQWHDHDSVAVCILSSVCLPTCITVDATVDTYGFSFVELEKDVRQLVRNLTAVSLRGTQPIEECKTNNDLVRAIAQGVQGLADAFALLHLPFASTQASQLSQLIYEHMYYYALDESHKLALVHGAYPGWFVVGKNGEVPPLKNGVFHWELKGVQPKPMEHANDSCVNALGASPGVIPLTYSSEGGTVSYIPDPKKERGRRTVCIPYTHLDWEGLRQKIIRDGVANSMLLALMPTMSTAKIMGYTDSFEPSENLVAFKNNQTSSSIQLFKPLYDDLHRLGVYTPEVFESIKQNIGSIQQLDLADDLIWLKEVYPTIYEVSPQVRLDLATVAQAFVDQSISLNAFFKIPTKALLTTWHMKAWRAGLKCLQYYVRSLPATNGANVGTTNRGKSGGTVRPVRVSTTGVVKKSVVKVSKSAGTEESDLPQCSIEARQNGVECESCMG
jgi:ribonucleoside-diphosphate reductase alpha chain